ncbi:hypothetical protein [Ruminococcus sp. 5_1_39BFAA]
MEIKIDTTGMKDIEKDGGVTAEEMAYQISPEYIANTVTINECKKNKRCE